MLFSVSTAWGIPLNLSASAASSSQINLTWEEDYPYYEDYTLVQRSPNGSSWTTIATLSTGTYDYSDTGLSAGTTYYYRIYSFSSTFYAGDYSNTASAATTGTSIAAPSGLSATTVSGTQINLSWADNSNNETGFKIERKTGSGGSWSQITVTAADATSHSDSGLAAGTTYYYRVRATTGSADSAYSGEANATTTPPPNAPSGLTAAAVSGTQINLAWSDNSSNETGFQIERSAGTTGVYTLIATVGANVTGFSNTGLPTNATYVYRVRATNADGDSGWSNGASATVGTPGSNVRNLVATVASASQVNLAWDDDDYALAYILGSGTPEYGYYQIERKTGAGGTWGIIAPTVVVTGYSDTTVTSGNVYYYRIYGHYASGVGTDSYSNEAIAEPGGVPAAPVSLTATAVGGSQIDLAWQDASAIETGFKIEKKQGSGGTWTQIATVGANVTGYSDPGIVTDAVLYYRVSATGSAGDSAWSNEASVVVAIAAPTGLSATAVSSSQVNLAWTDNSTLETGYKIERKTGAGGTWSQIALGNPNTPYYSDTGLAADTPYYYRVRATNGSLDSAYSNEDNATPFPGQVANETGSNTIDYTYDPFGNLIETNAGGVVTAVSYDTRGRKTGMNDPDMGAWTYVYNALGELVKQIDAKSQVTVMSYDLLGRMTSRTEADLTSTWTYDSCTKGVGKVCTAASDNDYSRTYAYDGLGRVQTITTHIDADYTIGYAYDSDGRLSTTTYPQGFVSRNLYNAYGYLNQVTDSGQTMTYWQLTAMDAQGHATGETLGNGLTSTTAFDAMGRQTGNTVSNGGTLQSFTYVYDTIGNLTSREDGVQGLTETFYYDTLNRLIQSSGAGLTTLSYSYDVRGNITYKSDVGEYHYPATNQAGPHAVASITGTVNGITNPTFSYDANGSLTAGLGRTLTWTSFNMPATMTGPNNLVPGTSATYQYIYNADHDRVKHIAQRAEGTYTTYYVHPGAQGALLYEKEVKEPTGGSAVTEHKNYLMAGSILIGVYIQSSAASDTVRYFSRDHLGSITLITDESGAVVERMAYDAFGKRRYPNGASDPYNALYGITTDRGFTTHEHLDEMALIHMNGRIYDPVLGRFMSADPTMQFPDNLQSYNRYSYGFNNPLSGIDPSGYSFWTKWRGTIIGIVATVVTYGAASYMMVGSFSMTALTAGSLNAFIAASAAGFVGGYAMTGTFKGALMGAASAALFSGVGVLADKLGEAAGLSGQALADSAIWGGAGLGRAALHAAAGCIQSQAMGGGCGSGAAAAFFSVSVGGSVQFDNYAANLVSRAVIGGTASALGGGKFENGAVTAAFVYMFNDAIHEAFDKKTYSSPTELSQALGEDGVVYGKRPLNGSGGLTAGEEGGFLDKHNLQAKHEQLFYNQDGELQNIGFFKQGVGPDPGFPDNISQYRFGPIYRGITVISSMLYPAGFSALTYSLTLNNCQDYADATRRRLGIIK